MSCRLFDGEHVPDVRVFGQTVDIYIRPRVEEIDRRAAAGVGAIIEDYMIRALMNVPEGVPIELRSLDGGTLLAMEGLLAVHAVEIVGDTACRRAIPPVDLVGISKAARDWSDVQGITWLATHGPRIVVAAKPMARRVMREIDPEVGVVVGEASGCVMLRSPGAAAVRPSWQRWSVAEAAFRMWRMQTRPQSLRCPAGCSPSNVPTR